MTYAALVEGMEESERAAFDRRLNGPQPLKRANQNVGGLMAAMMTPVDA